MHCSSQKWILSLWLTLADIIHISFFYQSASLVASSFDQILQLVYMLDSWKFLKLLSSTLFPYVFHISIWNVRFFESEKISCCFPKKVLSNYCGLKKKTKKDSFNNSSWENCSNCLKKLYFAIVKDKPFLISHSSDTKHNVCLCLIIILYCFSTQIWIQRLTSLIFHHIKTLEFYSHLATFSISWKAKFPTPRIDACLSMTKHFLFIFFQRTKSRS